MSGKENFDIFVGCNSGVVKGIKIEKNESTIKNLEDLISITEPNPVTAFSWSDKNEREILIAIAGKDKQGDQRVKIYDCENSTFSCSFACPCNVGNIHSISRFSKGILTASDSGQLFLWRFDREDGELVYHMGDNLKRMRHSPMNKNIIAFGGQENCLKIFDLERQVIQFVEKGLPHDSLELRIPIWISDLGFVPNSEQVVTVGRLGHVRLYDPRVQRRPVTHLTIEGEALTCLSVTPRESRIIVGSAKGKMNLIDLKMPGKILNTYKGATGSITGVTCSMNSSYVASISLDRYFRIHHMDTKKLLHKVYAKSKLTSLLTRSEFFIKSAENDYETMEHSESERKLK